MYFTHTHTRFFVFLLVCSLDQATMRGPYAHMQKSQPTTKTMPPLCVCVCVFMAANDAQTQALQPCSHS